MNAHLHLEKDMEKQGQGNTMMHLITRIVFTSSVLRVHDEIYWNTQSIDHLWWSLKVLYKKVHLLYQGSDVYWVWMLLIYLQRKYHAIDKTYLLLGLVCNTQLQNSTSSHFKTHGSGPAVYVQPAPPRGKERAAAYKCDTWASCRQKHHSFLLQTHLFKAANCITKH